MVTQLTRVLRKIDDSRVLHLVCVGYDQKHVFKRINYDYISGRMIDNFISPTNTLIKLSEGK
jgi:hypothetical protein